MPYTGASFCVSEECCKVQAAEEHVNNQLDKLAHSQQRASGEVWDLPAFTSTARRAKLVSTEHGRCAAGSLNDKIKNTAANCRANIDA